MIGDRGRRIPVVHLQRALELSDLSPAQIAANMGWLTRRGKGGGDVTRLLRTLGLREQMRDGKRQTVAHDQAVELLRAMHVDPMDVDL